MATQFQLSKNSKGIKPTVMTNILKWVVQKGIISFAGGMPDPSLFPLQEITKASQKIAKETGPIALQYAPAQGHLGLKEYFADYFRERGIKVSPDDLVPISGVQQGIHLTCELFLNTGNSILITAPTYFGALQTFDAFLVNYLSIPLTEKGIDLKQLEHIFKTKKPKFFYVIPNFQNPSGITIPESQRPEIVRLAKQYKIPIIEDDVFGDLYFDKPIRPLKSYDPEQVVYLTSFSKTISSGFRLGFAVPPKKLTQKYILAKQLNDVGSSTYAQYIIHEICNNGTFKSLLVKLRKEYKKRRNALLKSLNNYCYDFCHWTNPQGGMFLWVYLDKKIDAESLLTVCAKQGLVFLPGSAFFPHGDGGKNELRLSFSNLSPDKIEKGIQLFSKIANSL
ncbi:PLP-dependent aminotransferase family protein [Patescibacteria group bacterium]|nr:PLP-dependent aminotransferase family protein [Patescibacteria group bacterium]